MTSEVVRIEGLHKSFDKLEVLRGIDLAVREHEVVCLIGASGSGKSTLLRCINLLEPIDAGRILIDGTDITLPGVDANKVRRRIGIVFQAFNLFPHMSVLDNVTLGPRRVLRYAARPGRGRCDRAAGPLRAGRQAQRVPRSAVRRPAAAGGDRAGPGDAARADAPRRDHQRPRPGAGGRGPERRPRARRGRDDHDHRDPRDGLRPGYRQPGVLPRCRPDPGGGAARPRSSRRPASPGPGSSSTG